MLPVPLAPAKPCMAWFMALIVSTWRKMSLALREMQDIAVELTYEDVKYNFKVAPRGPETILLTLGDQSMQLRVDDALEPNTEKRFYLQYAFPPSSVGETGRTGAPGRREVGHGALAEKALRYALPDAKTFPYSMRVESLITESCGSSSMASVCGGCLALLDAGVPLTTSVAKNQGVPMPAPDVEQDYLDHLTNGGANGREAAGQADAEAAEPPSGRPPPCAQAAGALWHSPRWPSAVAARRAHPRVRDGRHRGLLRREQGEPRHPLAPVLPAGLQGDALGPAHHRLLGAHAGLLLRPQAGRRTTTSPALISLRSGCPAQSLFILRASRLVMKSQVRFSFLRSVRSNERMSGDETMHHA